MTRSRSSHLVMLMACFGLLVSGSGCPQSEGTQQRYTLSGTIRGQVIAGVNVELSGPIHATTLTDADGNYTFPGLVNGTYTVTPSLDGYEFAPTSRDVAVIDADPTPGQTYFFSGFRKFSISGTVSGDCPTDIRMDVSGQTTSTYPWRWSGRTGSFTFTGLSPGTYTIVASTLFQYCVLHPYPGTFDVTITDADATVSFVTIVMP